MTFLAELRRRNVIRMAGLYLVGAWLMVQIAETLLPIFGTPAWVLKTLVALLALGFVPALVFSWLYELTPEGLKRDADVTPDQSIARHTGRRMDRLIVMGLVAVVAVIAADRFWPREEGERGSESLSGLQDNASADALRPESDSDPLSPSSPAAPENSIAVLSFVNMSEEPGNEYFSDGISEEILNVLASSPDLRVAARTSSFTFKGRNKVVRDIARELGVRMVLEGSVRKQGDRVRITAQLIQADNGFHLWSQSYDRRLDDIFAIQDEIARAIGTALQVKLAGADAADGHSAGTKDLVAYDLYLRGIALWQKREEQALWQAIDLFQQAVATDPEYARGHAGLGLVYGLIDVFSARMPREQSSALAMDHGLRALALDPALPEAYAVLGLVATRQSRSDTALALFRRAIALRPSFATAHQWQARTLASAGQLESALTLARQSVALDPLSPIIGHNHAMILLTLGRYAEARAECERVLAFAPTFRNCFAGSGQASLLLGDLDRARESLDRAAADRPGASGQARELVDALAGRADRRALAQRLAAFELGSHLDPASGNALDSPDVAIVLALLGEYALALDHLERQNEGAGLLSVEMIPVMDPIRCDPRFVALIERSGAIDPRHASVCSGRP